MAVDPDCDDLKEIHPKVRRHCAHNYGESLNTWNNFFSAKLRLPEDEAEEVARDMEGIITFYCKSRNEKYNSTSGLTEVLAPFMMLELPMNDVYNCFYAMLYKYIPR